jgi:hypothetical protein
MWKSAQKMSSRKDRQKYTDLFTGAKSLKLVDLAIYWSIEDKDCDRFPLPLPTCFF